MKYIKERESLVAFGKEMKSSGLSPGTSGNLSIYLRDEGVMLISPSGIDYDKTKIEDIVAMDLDGNILEGDRKPSSEWHLHSLFYKKKDDIEAIVHTHSLYATTLACMGEDLKAVHYVIADAKTDRVTCSPYSRFGTEKLAKEAVETAGDANAVLLSNHGLLACGKDLKSAFGLAKNLEYIAHIQVLAGDKAKIISKENMQDVIQAFKSYGQVKEK